MLAQQMIVSDPHTAYVDEQKKLLGIISAGDMLDQMQTLKQDDGNDA